MTAKIGKSTKRLGAATPFAPDLSLNSEQRQLFDEHVRLVNIAAAKYGGKSRERRDEIAQEARIALAKAIKSYDADRRVPLGAYAWKCIRNRCLDFLKKRSQPKSHDDWAGRP